MLRLKTNGIYVKKCYHILFKQCIPSAALPAPWHPVCFSSTGLDGDICAWFVTCHSRLQEQVLHLELRNVSNALVKSWKKPPTLALCVTGCAFTDNTTILWQRSTGMCQQFSYGMWFCQSVLLNKCRTCGNLKPVLFLWIESLYFRFFF